ncbi:MULTISPECIES: response regulator [Marinomonas]|nr:MULTISPECIES: response regulator [Marinomonas]
MLITFYRLIIDDYTQLVVERESVQIERLASELELSLKQRVLGLEAFSTRFLDDNNELLKTQSLQTLMLRPSVAGDLFPDGLLAFDANAVAIAESIYVPNRLGTSYLDRPHFQRSFFTKKAIISEPILGRVTGLPLLSFLQPILSSDGEIKGFIAGLLDLSNTPLIDSKVALKDDSSVYSVVVDPRHRLFVSMQKRFTSPQRLPPEGTDAMVDAALSLASAGTLIEYNKKRYLVATEKLDTLGWIALRAIPYEDAIAPAKASYRHFLFITLCAMVLVSLAGVWMARSLTRPIEIMTHRIDKMVEKNTFDVDLQEQGGPEVRALVRAMNRLESERKATNATIRDTERFLSSVLEAASEFSIIATDANGLITAFNKGAEKMLGYTKLDTINKKTPAIFHLDHEVKARSAELTAELRKPIEGFRVFVEKAEAQGVETREWTYVHKNGEYIPVSLVVTSMRDESHNIIGYLGIAEDITERKRIDQMKSEFISTVSHELRTPLTSISGALGLMVGGSFGVLPEKANKLLITAHRNSKRLALLINDLLDFEKITAGKLHFDMQVQELTPLLEQALESIQEFSTERRVTATLTTSASYTLIKVDSQRLMQVLVNLLSNAIKFSPENGHVSVEVETFNDKVVVSVVDHGPGIPEAFRARVFQRFAQADSSDTRAKEGTGLGLAITRELIERMGGSVDFESVEGKGARFFFELPVMQPINSVSFVNHINTEITSKTQRILVIEDDADVANLLSIMLKEAGYVVDIALTGQDALNRLQVQSYDLVSVDLMLPDIGGLDVIRKLRQDSETLNLPIVVVSAKVEQGRLEISGDVSNIDWLAKPIDQQRLLSIVHHQLSLKSERHSRVLHVEDDADLHEVIRAMAGELFDFEVARTLEEARLKLKKEPFDVILLDVSLPDGVGWELLPEIRAFMPATKVVILSGEDIAVQEASKVEAVMLKSRLSSQELLNGINTRIQTSKPS